MNIQVRSRKNVNLLVFAILVVTIQARVFDSADGTVRSSIRDANKARVGVFDLSQTWQNVKSAVFMKVSCASCKLGVLLLRRIINDGQDFRSMSKFVLEVCTRFKIESPKVCQGIVERQGEDFFEAVNSSTLSTAEMCTFFLQSPCHDERYDWSINLSHKRNDNKRALNLSPKHLPKLKVLQISDTHWDPYYKEGTNTDCDEILCCRPDDSQPKSHLAMAGRWGNYQKCDMPMALFENALKHIADTHKDIDYVLWTGDLPPHETWKQTKEETLYNLKVSSALMAKHFKNIPIYPAVGNHDSAPVDSFAPPASPTKKNMSWLYDQLDIEWSRWLPSETSITIKRGAFYSTLARPGLRIISINGNYCSRFNFWLLKNNNDPVGQLSWLVRELELSESNGEKVHIVGHIPPGISDCIRVWSRNFYRIISRFESTIVAQFYGHSHFDEYQVFYDVNDIERPINIAYISPSLTPWQNLNPAYRIYYIDGDHPNTSRMVLDHETWKMDLGEANRIGKPMWHKAYTVKTSYKMPSLYPKDWDNLVTRMNDDQDLFDLFYRNYYRNSSVRPQCDNDCQKTLLCNLKTGRSRDGKSFCKDI